MSWRRRGRALRQGGFIYLTTGANGTGKTAFTLKAVREKQVAENRAVYWNGRFDLTEEKQAEFGWTKIDAKDWQQAPPGAIFFFDECHNDFPSRPTGSKTPDYVAAFGEHRKHGYDFFLLTQHPGNLDPFIKKIIASPGWHRHLKRNFGSRMISLIDYLAVMDRPEKPGAGKAGTVTIKPLPKEVYGWYKSAELHTAKVKIPRQVWIVLGALIMVPLLAYAAIRMVQRTYQPKASEEATAAGLVQGAAPAVDGKQPKSAASYVADYRPRIAGLMHTAPVYDKLTEPKRVPVPAACVEMASKGCKCYTQDATPYPVDLAMCRQLVQHGAFLAFLPEGERAERQTSAPRPDPQPQRVAALAVPSGLSLIGSLPQAGPVNPPPAPVVEQPQRVASVKR